MTGAISAPRHLIGGRLVGSDAAFQVVDPATGATFAHCPDASRDQLEAAVTAACAAFPEWSARPLTERRGMLFAFADALAAAEGELAPLLTREQGKPLGDARAEVRRTADHIRGLASLPLDDEILRDDGRERIVIGYRPLGVVGAIAPWNAPLVLAMHKVAQALYTGNTIVLKPSPFTPLTTLAAGALAAPLFPPGTLNIVAGGNDLGQWITAHPGIAKITFTGSVATGRKVMAAAGEGLKRVTLELGGNDPALVLADADLDHAAAAIARSAFGNCGQICMAVKRIYVDAAVHDAFADRFAAQVRALQVGVGSEPGTTLGPLQNRAQYDKVRALIEETRADPRAIFLTGDARVPPHGYFIAPTVVAGLADDAPLVRQEQFGPVVPILRFDGEDKAVTRANATELGLGASVWTRDLDRGERIARRLEAGSVWINGHGGNAPDVPFGGARDSGIGREHGVLGLRSYMEMQVRTIPA
jgi:acyl-CoA reductase-like NAD-dependent aldehyde dehydrogenase